MLFEELSIIGIDREDETKRNDKLNTDNGNDRSRPGQKDHRSALHLLAFFGFDHVIADEVDTSAPSVTPG